jgi:LPS export ABC transporter permease LptG
MDRYIIRHFFEKLTLTLIAFIVIFLVVDVIDHLDKFIDIDLDSFSIIKYYLHTIPWFISIGLPMALLLSTVFTFGILQKNQELTALKASGISIKRISISLLIFGLFFSVFSFYFDNYVVVSNFQKRTEIEEKFNLSSSRKKQINKQNIFRQLNKDKILHIGKYTHKTGAAHKVSIQTFSKGDILFRLDASLMKWSNDNAMWIIPEYTTRSWIDGKLQIHHSLQDTSIQFDFTPDDLTQEFVKPEEMNYWDLKQFVDRLISNGIHDPRWEVNLHFKTAFACSSLLMILFGLSLSIRKPRSNLAVGVGISIFVIFLYYAGIKFGQTMGFKGILPPMLSVWGANIIFLCIGLYLFVKTRT